MRLALASLLLLTACVPRAQYRHTVTELEETRQLVLLQQVAMAQMQSEIDRLEASRGPTRPAGPPPTAASAYQAHELGLPGLMALSPGQQAAALTTLNNAAGPCDPCVERGLSAAACLVQQPVCTNMPLLARRAVRLAAMGASGEAIQAALTYDAPWKPGIPDDGHARGPADAPVTIVMYMEAQCPYCVRASGTMQQLEERYGGKVRFLYEHMPLAFHDQARNAAIAMEAAAEQGRFWEYHDALYARAGELRSNEALLDEIAQQVGLDATRFQRDRGEPAVAARVDADIAQAGVLGVTGTPAFFVNGYSMRGAQPIERFAALIDRELGD